MGTAAPKLMQKAGQELPLKSAWVSGLDDSDPQSLSRARLAKIVKQCLPEPDVNSVVQLK